MKTATKSKINKTNLFASDSMRMVEWFGAINFDNLGKVIDRIKELMADTSDEEIKLMVNSYGGPTGVGLSFYDTMKNVFRAKLTTIGSGYVDSSAILVFLAGEKRYLTRNTTLLLHLAGREFDVDKRFSTRDMENMLKEDKVKDYQYACVLSDVTVGRYSPEAILEMMERHTVLTAEEAVNMGLAHHLI